MIRSVLTALAIGLPCSLSSASAAEPVAPRAEPPLAARGNQPNFVVILCDDLGYGDLGCYGHPRIKTPHLDRLAREGIRFTDCYAAAPVCSPSRAGLLTGRTPHRLGIFDWIPAGSPVHLRPDETTVATLLKQAGYATCHSGKWHCNGKFNDPEQPQPGDHGFDHWFSAQNNAGPSHRDPVNFVRNGNPVGPMTGYSSTLIVDEAIGWLNGRDAQVPFFLFVCFHSPHEPIATSEEFTRLYPEAKTPEQAAYFGNVSQMDHEVGRLLARLDELALSDSTFVFFTSDNGPETLGRYRGAERSYGSPGSLRGMKLHLYEGGIRVPGICRFPGRAPAGRVSAVPVSGADLLPTLCELAGAAVPTDRAFDGTSLVPALEGRALERKTPLYWRYDKALGGKTLALRRGRWKLLADPTFEHIELYDLSRDPGEQHDRSADEPEIAAELARLLRDKDAEVSRDATAE